MTESIRTDNPLGYEKISKLLKKFAVPSVVAMLVSSFYNVVDQIFIGNFVGPIGNTATNIAFPLTTICIAISSLVGIGGASRFSIELGKGNKEEAKRCVSNAFWTALILGGIYALLAAAFANPLLKLFGATENALPYTLQYSNIIFIGMPMLICSNVLSNLIRADGSPKYSMTCMVVGGVVNIILDAIFVPLGEIYYGMGMAGAALATVISQGVSLVIAMNYLSKFKTVEIDLKGFEFIPKKAYKICSLGMSNSFNHIAMCVVQVVMNNQLATYGAMSEYGADTPLAAFGVVMKVNSILIAVFVGMCQGAQPIIGYNYGARQYGRAKETCVLACKICMAVAFVGFIVFQTVPQYIVAIFGSGDALYNEFAEKTMRTFLFMIICTGAQIVLSNYFSAIGKPIKGVILSLTRQLLLIVPLMIILPKFFGLTGMLYAAPITDFIAFLLATSFILYEFRLEGYPKRNSKK